MAVASLGGAPPRSARGLTGCAGPCRRPTRRSAASRTASASASATRRRGSLGAVAASCRPANNAFERTGKAPCRSEVTVVSAPRLRHLPLPTRHLPLPLTAVALHVSHTHTTEQPSELLCELHCPLKWVLDQTRRLGITLTVILDSGVVCLAAVRVYRFGARVHLGQLPASREGRAAGPPWRGPWRAPAFAVLPVESCGGPRRVSGGLQARQNAFSAPRRQLLGPRGANSPQGL